MRERWISHIDYEESSNEPRNPRNVWLETHTRKTRSLCPGERDSPETPNPTFAIPFFFGNTHKYPKGATLFPK